MADPLCDALYRAFLPLTECEYGLGRGLCSFCEGWGFCRDAMKYASVGADVVRAMPVSADIGRARKMADLIYPDEVNDDLERILGTICFVAGSWCQIFRAAGYEIKTKAEAEQAFFIDWLLRHYLRDPENWIDNADAEIRAMKSKIAVKETCDD